MWFSNIRCHRAANLQGHRPQRSHPIGAGSSIPAARTVRVHTIDQLILADRFQRVLMYLYQGVH